MLVYPPILPLSVFINVIVAPLLSQFLWKYLALSPSFVALYNKLNFILLLLSNQLYINSYSSLLTKFKHLKLLYKLSFIILGILSILSFL